MSLLLDTHVWLWSQATPEKLGSETASLLCSVEQAVFVSTISTLEIARLATLGRVELGRELTDWLTASLDFLSASTIELTHDIAAEAYRLPGSFHRDPADRILVATARIHGLTLLTAERLILAYPHVRSLDAAS